MNKQYLINIILIIVFILSSPCYGVDNQKSNNEITIKINNAEKSETDNLLRNIWGKMKLEIIEGNYEKALEYFYESTKQNYREIFNELGERNKEIFGFPEKLTLLEINKRFAKYNYVVEEGKEKHSYLLVFIKDPDGIWKILEY